jgi:lysophospholipase L1-like esterase
LRLIPIRGIKVVCRAISFLQVLKQIKSILFKVKRMKQKLPTLSGISKLWMTFLLLFCSGFLTAGNVMVTFRVNMSAAYPTSGVYVGSDWAGWSLDKFQLLTDADHDSIFEITIYLPAGESYNYRYTRGNTNWNNFESMVGTVCGSGSSNADRNIVVPQLNTVLDIVCFNACADCGSTETTNLNLSLDMTGLAVSSNGVHVAGSFNNWSTTTLELKDNNSDNIYDISIPLIPNLDYEYKFLNGNTLNDAEVVFGTCEFRSKRRVSVYGEALNVPVVKFSSCNADGSQITDTKIACIGNSITEGGAGNYYNSWPMRLRDMLGNGYYTENLGVSGTTMSKVGDSPWWNQPQYNYTFSLNPDIILIKLGTNDSKSNNWKPVNYKADYIDMIDKFRAMPSHPAIYVVTPAKAYSAAYNINDNTIVMKIIPILHQIAFEKGVHLIDMYNATTYMPANFPDGIHPNSAGAMVIAQKAKENILKAKPVISLVEATTDTTVNTLYQWFYNDTPVPGANHHTINVTQEGTYKVAVKMSNASSDIFVSEPFTVVLPQGISTAGLTTDYDVVYKVNNTLGSHTILIYPNPASDVIVIENALHSDVTILDETGKVVVNQKNIDNNQSINIPELKNGVYFIRLTKDNSSVTRQIVVL